MDLMRTLLAGWTGGGPPRGEELEGDTLVGNGHLGEVQTPEVRQERGKAHSVLQALATIAKQESIPSPIKNGLE
jgi:hypothetical protein